MGKSVSGNKMVSVQMGIASFSLAPIISDMFYTYRYTVYLETKSELKVMREIGSSGIFCKTELFLFLSSAMYYTSLV